MPVKSCSDGVTFPSKEGVNFSSHLSSNTGRNVQECDMEGFFLGNIELFYQKPYCFFYQLYFCFTASVDLHCIRSLWCYSS